MIIEETKVSFLGGTQIDDAVREATDFATKNECVVRFNFNSDKHRVNSLGQHSFWKEEWN